MSQHLQAIATLFSLVNPMVCAMMFTGIVAGQSRAVAIRTASSAMPTVAAVLLMAAFVGAPLLKVFGISLDAFSVAGGAVLAFIGVSMMQGSASPSTPLADADGTAAQAPGSPNIARLVMFAASPGTITGVMTIVAAHRRGPVPVTAVVAILIVTAVTWGVLVLAAYRPGSGKPSLASDMKSRYMGLIIIAMGLQFALTGLKGFFAG
ncbi:MarC family protein [Tropicimonas sp. IMCC34043]|uniref:MarC family protein n=1 Tax=Tropicimonas sp. IMCC34043 TaxID=2248760 RepID=UPI000E2593A6|nr:MarC family protein [Tropicimonas sp. IMCC34043]